MQVRGAIRRRLGGSVVALALAIPRAALADDVDAARAAFLEARALGNQGRWAEAANRYGASLRLHRSALTLYSLGVAQKESGRLVEARESFVAFLAEPSTEKTRAYEPRAREAMADLDRRAAHVTIVLEPGPIEHPTVAIDGDMVPGEGLTRTRPVNPGTHEVVARAPGRTDARARLTIPEGGAATVTLTLAEIPAPGAPAPSAAGRWDDGRDGGADPDHAASGRRTTPDAAVRPDGSGRRRLRRGPLRRAGRGGPGPRGDGRHRPGRRRRAGQGDRGRRARRRWDRHGRRRAGAAPDGVPGAPRSRARRGARWITSDGAGMSLHF